MCGSYQGLRADKDRFRKETWQKLILDFGFLVGIAGGDQGKVQVSAPLSRACCARSLGSTVCPLSNRTLASSLAEEATTCCDRVVSKFET